MKNLQNSLAALPLALALSFNPMGASAQETAQDNAPNDGFSFSCDAPDLKRAFATEMSDQYPQDMSQLSPLEFAMMQNDIAQLYEQYVVDQVYPGTVSISTSTAIEMPFGINPNSGQPPVSRNSRGIGSGYIIDADQGYIVTNAHVVGNNAEGAAKLSITINLYDPAAVDYIGEEITANLIGIDNSGAIDVAVLQIDVGDRNLTCVPFGDSDLAAVGEDVFAIGNGRGQDFSVSAGIISHGYRSYQSAFHDVLQTDTTINPGNSGGPLFNYNGEVIGVNTAIITKGGGSDGIGFAIPSNVVADIANKLIIHGEIKRGWLGVGIQDLNDEQLGSLDGAYTEGVLVNGVSPSTPAEAAGIVEGDIILKVNNTPVGSASELSRTVANYRPGTKVDFTLQRDNTIIVVEVTLGDRDIGAPIAPNTDNDILPQPDDAPLPDGGAPPPDGDAPAPDAPTPDAAPDAAPAPNANPAPVPDATPLLPPQSVRPPTGRLDGMGGGPN